jgi:hypothetical protein
MKTPICLFALLVLACGEADEMPDDCTPEVVDASAAARRCLVISAPENARVRVLGDTGPGSAEVVLMEGESYEILSCQPPEQVGPATSERCE